MVNVFPVASETFIERELELLSARGWDIQILTLRRGIVNSSTSEFAAKMNSTATVVYQSPRWQRLLTLISEIACHPLRSFRTMSTALYDAVHPGESMTLLQRCKLIYQAATTLRVAHLLRPMALELLHCHFAHAPTTFGMYLAMQLGLPFTFTGHANDLFPNRLLLKRKLQRATQLIAISDWHARLYRDIEPNCRERVTTVRCGVDVALWQNQSSSDLSNGDMHVLRVLTVCRLVAKKGVDSLLRAAAIARHEIGIPLRLTVIGWGEEESSLKTLSHALHLDDAVDWLGEVPSATVREQLSCSDVFALLCRIADNGDRDGIPVSIMEAMAFEIPVICGDLPAIRELVIHGITGFMVDPDNPSELASALARLYEDADLRSAIAVRGRELIDQEYSSQLNISRLEVVFGRALAGAGRVNDGRWSEDVSR